MVVLLFSFFIGSWATCQNPTAVSVTQCIRNVFAPIVPSESSVSSIEAPDAQAVEELKDCHMEVEIPVDPQIKSSTHSFFESAFFRETPSSLSQVRRGLYDLSQPA